jgi:hypothetical protein
MLRFCNCRIVDGVSSPAAALARPDPIAAAASADAITARRLIDTELPLFRDAFQPSDILLSAWFQTYGRAPQRKQR